MTPETYIAEALGLHSAVGFGKCRCGWTTEVELGRSWREKHEAHQASVVATLMVAVVHASATKVLSDFDTVMNVKGEV